MTTADVDVIVPVHKGGALLRAALGRPAPRVWWT